MLVRLLLLFLICQSKGDLVYKCNNVENEQDSLKFTPAGDGVLGRYTAELCTLKNPNTTWWGVYISYYRGMADCNELLHGMSTHVYSHSTQHKNLKSIRDINCNNICISMDFDLIFAGCYSINSMLTKEYTTLQRISNKVTIKNNLTLTQLEHSQNHVEYSQKDEFVLLRWIMAVPIAQPFRVKLWQDDPTDYEIISEKCTLGESAYEVLCKFNVSEGCYRANLKHDPSWGSVFTYSKTYLSFKYSFCKSG